jgi:succinate-semialdehyde dehydrogenase/glutarate-semialdehyde dehydrogenase
MAVATSRKHAVTNPSTLEHVGEVEFSSVEDVQREIQHAHEAFAKWSKMPFAERAAILRKAAELLRKFSDEIAATLTREQGKPLKEAKIEVERTADTFDLYAADDMGALVNTVELPGKSARVVRRPLGACAAIVPWNFPLTLMANKLVPALATGNTVVVKPAPSTPLAATRCIELLYEAGLPKGVVGIVVGGADVGAALIEHPQIRKVSFTGSTTTGKAIMALAAKGLKRLTLELGGNDAMIVCEDADVVSAARAAAVGRFFNAGQACIATKRIYVHRSKYDEFVERVTERAAKLPIGDGFDPNVRMGPLHSQPQRESVEGFVRDAVAQGAKASAGGKRPDAGKGYFFEPTVLVDVPDNARLIREECFGPVLPVMPFDSMDEVIARANSTVFGLGSSIWTNDKAVQERAVRELDAGYTWINDIATDYDRLPFGGVKESGFGKERGTEVLGEYLELKSVVAGAAHG